MFAEHQDSREELEENNFADFICSFENLLTYIFPKSCLYFITTEVNFLFSRTGSTAAELRSKEQQLASCEEQLSAVCGSQGLEHDLSRLQDDLDKTSKQRGVWGGGSVCVCV